MTDLLRGERARCTREKEGQVWIQTSNPAKPPVIYPISTWTNRKSSAAISIQPWRPSALRRETTTSQSQLPAHS